MVPFFSVVIPAYNRASFLEKAIDSIQRQIFKDFELLVVDDGSTDNTRELVSRLMENDNRIKYFYQENAERGAARNRGFALAKGEFVIFFDSDDEMKENYLESLHAGIKGNPSYNFYAVKYTFIENGREYRSSISSFRPGVYDVNIVLKGNPFACNFCVRKGDPQIKPFMEDRTLATMEDWMFLVENLKQHNLYLFDVVGMSMHQHSGRSMQDNSQVIERRLRAAGYLDGRVAFTDRERKVLWGYSYYFCSIHAYLDFNKRAALQYLRKAASYCGWNKPFLIAYLKFLIGKGAINNLTGIIQKYLRYDLDRY